MGHQRAVEGIEVDGREFPGSPVVRTLYSHREGPDSVHVRGTKIPQAAEWDQNKEVDGKSQTS